jgi:hypothetical protein
MRIPDRAAEQAVAFTRTLHLARADFAEMPGLILTPRQAARLWAADVDVCHEVLARLVEARYLARVGDSFVRA